MQQEQPRPVFFANRRLVDTVQYGPLRVGDSSLQGAWTCDYCRQPCAQYARFQVWAGAFDPVAQREQLVGVGSFCLPECCAAWNQYKSRNTSTEQCRERRHALLERKYGRTIVPSPAPSQIHQMVRGVWLTECRAQLVAEDAEIAHTELFVQQPHIREMRK